MILLSFMLSTHMFKISPDTPFMYILGLASTQVLLKTVPVAWHFTVYMEPHSQVIMGIICKVGSV